MCQQNGPKLGVPPLPKHGRQTEVGGDCIIPAKKKGDSKFTKEIKSKTPDEREL